MEVKKTDARDIEVLINLRLEMLRAANNLSDDAKFGKELVELSREYLETRRRYLPWMETKLQDAPL